MSPNGRVLSYRLTEAEICERLTSFERMLFFPDGSTLGTSVRILWRPIETIEVPPPSAMSRSRSPALALPPIA